MALDCPYATARMKPDSYQWSAMGFVDDLGAHPQLGSRLLNRQRLGQVAIWHWSFHTADPTCWSALKGKSAASPTLKARSTHKDRGRHRTSCEDSGFLWLPFPNKHDEGKGVQREDCREDPADTPAIGGIRS